MDDQSWALIGGIGGSVLGVLGGVAGTYCSLKNARGPRQRRLMVRFAASTWLLVTAGLAWLLLAPRPWNGLGMAAPFLTLFLASRRDARRWRARVAAGDPGPASEASAFHPRGSDGPSPPESRPRIG